MESRTLCFVSCTTKNDSGLPAVADPGENLTEALYSNFGHGRCGGRG